ncbi:MAG: DUF5113 domain-containing protein [Bacteroides sp.]
MNRTLPFAPLAPFALCLLLAAAACFSCVGTAPTREVRLIDSLNHRAYAYRYKDLDSSYLAARQAYENGSAFYAEGRAEASNNLAFCAFMQMDFDEAERLHRAVYHLSKNELELLIADVGLMKIYQRTVMNKEYYDFRNSAFRRMKRIREEGVLFADKREELRLSYALSEFYIVSAVYYYYLRQRPEAMASLEKIPQDDTLAADTNQWLYFHYVKGSASLCAGTSPDQRRLADFDELFTTWKTASQQGYRYFEGNSAQGLANLMASPDAFAFFHRRRMHALSLLGVPVDSLLPLRLGQSALRTFGQYKDLYQIAGSYVSIGKYLNAHGRYAEALDTLAKALDCVNNHHLTYYHEAKDTLDKLQTYLDRDTIYTELTWIGKEKVKTVPEWISRIREQLSVSYAGLGEKIPSNNNRNIYLDILNNTRQNKELESRYQSLAAESKQLNGVLLAVIAGLLLVVVLFWLFNERSKVRNRLYMERLQQTLMLCRDITASIPMNVPLVQQGIDRLLGGGRVALRLTEEEKAEFIPCHRLSRDEQALIRVLMPYVEWALDNEQTLASLSDERSQLEKQRYVYEQHIAKNKRENLIKKSCLAIVNGINPFIDRIANEVHKLTAKGFIDDPRIKREKYQYIDELVTTINEYNDILALWIKMKQGSLSLNIETFALNELFELLAKGRRSFETKHQQLEITPTDVLLKADKALTLFMINTLAENARKYTPEGGTVKIYARLAADAVEISVEDNGRGFSPEDAELIRSEKVYNPQTIGLKDASDPEQLKKNKGSGFGLMNCKGIIEKYRKTNELFRVCTFCVESELGKGSRFYFRLPLGVRKGLGVWLCCLLLSGAMGSCQQHPTTYPERLSKNAAATQTNDSDYERLLNRASDFANAAYFANVDEDYPLALQYIDSAMLLLNEHYAAYARTPRRYMKLNSEEAPAELMWWNELFDSDFHVILDIRNEAAVAFLALKQLDAYSYNNDAYTDLYKLSSEDQSIEGYCRQLERSTTNKTVGLILCIVLLVALVLGYYVLYIRKRLLNRMNLEQVLEINKKIFASSLVRTQESIEALQREEDTLKEIPQRIINEAFDAINELLAINTLGIAVYSETTRRLEYAANPRSDEMPQRVQHCFDQQEYLWDAHSQALPLMVDAAGGHLCVGVLYLERREGTGQESDRLLVELVARYVAIVVFNAVVKLAVKYRDIESAHEETRRASWEDSLLHVQNMVLDNCLSTIKHETIYYPNKIKQLVHRLNAQHLAEAAERENVEAISELIAYYKGIFTILSSCASRQLEEVTFRRTTIPVPELLDAARKYFNKASKGKAHPGVYLEIACAANFSVTGDVNQLRFLFENLIDEALAVPEPGGLKLAAVADGCYIRFLFTDSRREKSVEALNQLFYPNLARMTSGEKGELRGTEYLVCKQIIRDHDEFAGCRGCRINAEPAARGGGFTVYCTIPRRMNRNDNPIDNNDNE